jgi:hypothetical protein
MIWWLSQPAIPRVKLRQNGIVFFPIKLAVFLASGAAYMKLHLFRQDLQDYQDFLGLVQQYLVHPDDPVKNENSNAIWFPFRLNWLHRRPASALTTYNIQLATYI